MLQLHGVLWLARVFHGAVYTIEFILREKENFTFNDKLFLSNLYTFI